MIVSKKVYPKLYIMMKYIIYLLGKKFMNTYKKRKNYFINNGISIEITHNRNVLVADYIDNIKFQIILVGGLRNK